MFGNYSERFKRGKLVDHNRKVWWETRGLQKHKNDKVVTLVIFLEFIEQGIIWSLHSAQLAFFLRHLLL